MKIQPAKVRAEEALNRALQIEPGSGCAYRDLAALAAYKEDYPQAIAYASKAVTCKNPDRSAFWRRAKVYYSMHKLNEALADVTEFLKHPPPRHIEQLAFKAQLLEEMGRYDQAIVAYKDAAPYRKDWAYFQVLRCLKLANRLDEGISEASKLLAATPQNDDVLHMRAQMFAKKKNLKAALADYSMAIAVEPLSQYYRERAGIYDALGQHDLAIKDRQKADKHESSQRED